MSQDNRLDIIKRMTAAAMAIGVLTLVVQPVILKLLCVATAGLVGILALWRYIDYYNDVYDPAKRRRTDTIVAAVPPLLGVAYLISDAVNPTFYGVFLQNINTASIFAFTAFVAFVIYSIGLALSSFKPIAKAFVGSSLLLFLLAVESQGSVPCDDGDDDSSSCIDKATLHRERSTGSTAGRYIIYLSAAYIGLAGLTLKREKVE